MTPVSVLMAKTIPYAEFSKRYHLACSKHLLRSIYMSQHALISYKCLLEIGLSEEEVKCYYLFLEVYFQHRTHAIDRLFFSVDGLVRLMRKQAWLKDKQMREVFRGTSKVPASRNAFMRIGQGPLKASINGLIKKKAIIWAEREREVELYPFLFKNLNLNGGRSTWNKRTYQPVGEDDRYSMRTKFPCSLEGGDIYAEFRPVEEDRDYTRKEIFEWQAKVKDDDFIEEEWTAFFGDSTLLEGKAYLDWFFLRSSTKEIDFIEDGIEQDLFKQPLSSTELRNQCKMYMAELDFTLGYPLVYLLLNEKNEFEEGWISQRLNKLGSCRIPIQAVREHPYLFTLDNEIVKNGKKPMEVLKNERTKAQEKTDT